MRKSFCFINIWWSSFCCLTFVKSMSYSNKTLIISKDFLHMLSKLTKDDQAFIQGFTECNANIVERQTQRGKITLNRDKKNVSMRRGNNRLNIVEDQRRSRRLISTSMAKARTINKATKIISISSLPCSMIKLPYQAQDLPISTKSTNEKTLKQLWNESKTLQMQGKYKTSPKD